VLQGQDFIEDVQSVSQESDNLHLWWLGQSGYLVHWRSNYVLLDPYLSDSLTTKYTGTDKPHVRMTHRVIEPGQLDFIRAVSSSHNHTDHLDAETLGPLMAANPDLTVVVAKANLAFAADRLQVPATRLTAAKVGEALSVDPFTFHAIPAAHEELDMDEEGCHRYVGYVVEAGPWTIYHSGDTVRYDHMLDWFEPFSVDVAILPINGADPSKGVPGNLAGPEAARLAKDMKARMVIPCHYDMFEFNTASPDAFVQAAESLDQPYKVLHCGQRWSTEQFEGRGW
jgi:L-ascorbate metabolism protein UlaG (beta-lactamase superfamily)